MENGNLADAIREIQNTARAAVENIYMIDAKDKDGKSLVFPVIVAKDSDGSAESISLLEDVKKAHVAADEMRLKHAEGPDFRQGIAAHQSIESFIAHAIRFKAPHSAIWANAAKRELVAVLDYHPEGATSPPKWGRHRGLYPCPLSESWVAWGGGRALKLDQDAFAALLDARDRELTEGSFWHAGKAPDPAALITLANNLEVYSNASAKRTRDPNTGRLRISFDEEKGVKGDVFPPPAFLINIPVFEDQKPIPLEVRLRVSVEEARAIFETQIHAAGEVLRQAYAALCERVKTETGLPVFVGTPE